MLRADAVHRVRRARFARHKLQGHGVQLHLYTCITQHTDKAPRILRACKLFLKAVQAEAVVDALVQNAAKLFVPLQHQNAAQPVLPRAARRRKPCRAAAYHNKVKHPAHPLCPVWFRR